MTKPPAPFSFKSDDRSTPGYRRYAVTHEPEGAIGSVSRYEDGAWRALAPEGSEVNSPGYTGYSTRTGAAAALLQHARDPKFFEHQNGLYGWALDVWGQRVEVSPSHVTYVGECLTRDAGSVLLSCLVAKFSAHFSPNTEDPERTFVTVKAPRFHLQAALDGPAACAAA